MTKPYENKAYKPPVSTTLNGRPILIDEEDVDVLTLYNWLDCGRYFRATITTNKVEYLHRFLMKADEEMMVDHIDGNPFNLSKSNVRICSRQENNRNRRKSPGKTSQFKGVHWSKTMKRWEASISINRTTKHLGFFFSEIEAAEKYNRAAKKYFREFAVLNITKEVDQ